MAGSDLRYQWYITMVIVSEYELECSKENEIFGKKQGRSVLFRALQFVVPEGS